MSPYVPKVVGQEDYVYVWTGGIEGVGDGSDKLATIGANPDRDSFGKVVSTASVGGRHEAGEGDFTDDRRYFWAGGLEDSKIFIFDVASDPAHPKLVRTIDSFVKDSGGVTAPHAFYPLPGRMLIAGLSSAGDSGGTGRTALVEYRNDGSYIHTVWLPEGAKYGYDARVQPRLNRMLTSSFTGPKNYLRDLPGLLADREAMKQFGRTMVLWDFHARKPLQVLDVPGAPLVVRWALQPTHDYAFVVTALGAKVWLIARQPDGSFSAEPVADVGDAGKVSLPVDASLSLDDRFLFVTTLGDGNCRVYDVADPRHPKLLTTERIGSQVARVSQTWYGGNVYFSSSLFSRWDQAGAEQFLKAYRWDGKKLAPLFAVDFRKADLGRPLAMRFGQDRFYKNEIEVSGAGKSGVQQGPRSVDAAQYDYTFAFGTFHPDYTPPAAGSYELPVAGRVSDHELRASDGGSTTLFAAKQDRLAVVAFVYTSCHEITGCPFSLGVMQRLDRVVSADRELARRVKLVTVSFDPERDTPAKMAALRALQQPRTDWLFATTPSEAEIRPILGDFEQPVSKLLLRDGQWSGVFRHVLKVFLLDEGNRIRNVYSVGFLNPDLVLSDIHTLLMPTRVDREVTGP